MIATTRSGQTDLTNTLNLWHTQHSSLVLTLAARVEGIPSNIS